MRPWCAPADCHTLGEYARAVSALNYVKLRESRARSRPGYFWKALLNLAAEQWSLPSQEIGRETLSAAIDIPASSVAQGVIAHCCQEQLTRLGNDLCEACRARTSHPINRRRLVAIQNTRTSRVRIREEGWWACGVDVDFTAPSRWALRLSPVRGRRPHKKIDSWGSKNIVSTRSAVVCSHGPRQFGPRETVG
jgi:hypothetical protein